MTLTAKLAIAMIALVAIAVCAVGWLSYSSLVQALLPRILDRIETHSKFVASDLESSVRNARSDVVTFHGLAAVAGVMRAHLNGGIDPADLTPEAVWRERLAARLAAQMPLRPAYSLRFIGIEDGHRELVRVDRSGPNETVRIVPESELKQVGDAAYFRDTIKLAPTEIYISPVDLSEENGVIETPHVPTMRIAMPVMAPDGKPFGIVIATADMRPALNRARTSVRLGEEVYVVDARGNYLVHPDRSREFGAQLGKPIDWRKDFPDLAASAGTMQSAAYMPPNEGGPRRGEAMAPALLIGSEWTAVIESMSNAVFMAPAQAIRKSSITVGLLAVLCATVLALLIARSLTRPIVELTEAVEAAARSGTAAIPTDARGETGVLARAFAHVIKEANAKAAELEREVEEHLRTIAARDHHAARERLFSAAVESSNDAIITLSLDGTITGWNSAAERLFGYTAAEAAGHSVAMLVPEERLPEVQDILRRIGWGESIEQNETVRLHKDGRPIEVSLSISPIRAPSGVTIGISKVVRDITDRNKTRQALRQQTEELRRVFETSQDLILVMDSRGYLVQISPSCEAVLGYRPEEMIGRSGVDFIHSDHLENARDEMRAARRGLRPKFSDTRGLHKDGRPVWLSWLGTWSEPAKRFFLVGRDMTESRLAQETLRESEQLARGIINSALDAFVQADERGIVRDWNSQAEIIFGWSRPEVLGKNIFELLAPNPNQGPIRADLAHFLTSGLEQVARPRREVQARRRDGSEFIAELSITALRTRDGFVFNCFMRDLTQSRMAQETLRESEQLARGIIDTALDAFVQVDHRWNVLDWNSQADLLLGWRREETLERNVFDLIAPNPGQSQVRLALERLLSSDPDPEIKLRREALIRRRDGSQFIAELSITALQTRNGLVFNCFMRDLTESRLVQETLRENERMARGIIDTALDAFLQVDQSWTIRDWNSQAGLLFGWPREEALGKNAFDLLAANPDQPIRMALERILASGPDQDIKFRREAQVRRRDGTEFTAEVSLTLLNTHAGFVFNAFVRDLTDKITAEDRIRQAEKMEAVGQLTGGIAHDFNNILTVITGTIEILADAVKGEPQLSAITRMIDEAASRGADLTQHLLAFARKQPLEPRETDVNTLIIDTAKLLQRTLGEHVEIESVFEDEICPALVDPNQLATAILNLALNARDAMPDGGKLILETGTAMLDEKYAEIHSDVRPGRYALIAVSDTGTGIPADMLDKVFNPFFTSKGPGKGTGLGLSMVYGFVKQSAGHIMIYSEQGHGTTIKMYLPAAAGTLHTVEPGPAPVVKGGHETILVVEDDKLVRNYVLTQLHSLGYVTLDAANATEALAIAGAGHPFDLLFTDVIMPGINGRQLANEILKIKPGLRVLFTSGYTENAIIHHGRLDEGVLLLAKPYRKSDMAIMIRKALAG